MQLQGRFELVTKDVALLKDNFETRTRELTAKIDKETEAVLERMGETKSGIEDHVEHVFSSKFLGMTGTLVGSFVTIVGLWSAIENQFTTTGKVISALGAGGAICLIAWVCARKEGKPRKK